MPASYKVRSKYRHTTYYHHYHAPIRYDCYRINNSIIIIMTAQYQTWEDNPPHSAMKQQPGVLYQRYDPSSSSPGPTYTYGNDRTNASTSTASHHSSMGERCCNHLKDFIALSMVAAFMIFSGWVCYYLISNYG